MESNETELVVFAKEARSLVQCISVPYIDNLLNMKCVNLNSKSEVLAELVENVWRTTDGKVP